MTFSSTSDPSLRSPARPGLPAFALRTGGFSVLAAACLLGVFSASCVLHETPVRGEDGTGQATITGELQQWHNVTLSLDGPWASEKGEPNPFLDYRMTVTFTHASGSPRYQTPGYFAADGDAAQTSAESGAVWRAHLAPDKTGDWTYEIAFVAGKGVAVGPESSGVPLEKFHGGTGKFTIASSDKTGRDLRSKGRLDYVGQRYLQFRGNGEWFLKQGADAPENLLAYVDFDGPQGRDGQNDRLMKSWAPHVRDWREGDPTWGDGKGKGLIGAINYLASEGMNAFSFLTLNINGDDKNVFPYLDYAERRRLDVSRLAQWEIVLTHGDRQGMFLHFKTLETENELLLDGGDLGVERKLYYRELIARFAHHLALNWNLGEEINNASTAQKQAWAHYFWTTDPYQHPIVIHNGASHFDLMGPYDPAAGTGSDLTGFSLQTNNPDFSDTFNRITPYLQRSVKAGKPWTVALDEPGDATHALRPDNDAGDSHEDGRKNALWPTLLAGGWGNEWYFGYKHAESDLTLNDFRSRDVWWDYPRFALVFFAQHAIPFQEMENANRLSSVAGSYVFAKPGECYVVYLPRGGSCVLDLSSQKGPFTVAWYDPRHGGKLQQGSTPTISGGGKTSLGAPPSDSRSDWVILVRSQPAGPGQ
ncbi:DUF5060 domain-containing protein [Lignipirellula cremea]|uniref:DUF5060 domain-containing protein n=1 Tax=Lignipirellula cremea TaxID=2528010 RepID=A0A518DPH9_9BACT|nr:DUF5060 domain-containing protein [Lignipirellula cremea]QDU93750.1 hypothetical protein Pla8534_15330 [Lignipirellula cremea]